MLNTHQLALFFKGWFYLSEIAVSGLARCITFQVISV